MTIQESTYPQASQLELEGGSNACNFNMRLSSSCSEFVEAQLLRVDMIDFRPLVFATTLHLRNQLHDGLVKRSSQIHFGITYTSLDFIWAFKIWIQGVFHLDNLKNRT